MLPKQLLVLDTNVVCQIATDRRSAAGLASFAREGGSVQIADGAAVELFARLHAKRVRWQDWLYAREVLDGILDPESPVALGGRELLAAAGLVIPDREPTLPVHEQLEINRRAWELLRTAEDLSRLRDVTGVIHVNGRRSLLKVKTADASKSVLTTKAAWVGMFDGYPRAAEADGLVIAGRGIPTDLLERQVQSLAAFLDRKVGLQDPPASLRMDAMMRVHILLSLRAIRRKDTYNAKKSANDAFDYDLLRYLAVPAGLCTSDRGIRNDLAAANAWQRSWVVLPRSWMTQPAGSVCSHSVGRAS